MILICPNLFFVLLANRSLSIPQQPTGGMSQFNPSTTIPTTPGTGSRPQLASILREGRKSANIHLSSGVIWGIPVLMNRAIFVETAIVILLLPRHGPFFRPGRRRLSRRAGGQGWPRLRPP
jgi:hypothetical protein